MRLAARLQERALCAMFFVTPPKASRTGCAPLEAS